MEKFALALLAVLSAQLFVFAQEAAGISIIPQPRSVERLKGEFRLNHKTRIATTDDAGRRSAGMLNDLLLKNYGFKLEYVSAAGGGKPKDNVIVFLPASQRAVGQPPAESYGLTVSPKAVQIIGDEAGMFYGVQSLLQLLPPDFKGEAKLPALDIADAPRFSYRGMHLDVVRHFFPVEFVKKYLDLMAQYKFNRFHWHLTDDQGWRVEIKKYPRLTGVGGYRRETVKDRHLEPYVGDGVPYGGFYTQEQIREVVAYAKARHITVIPEIELPGHASAALAAYPELGCKENYEYKVQTTWGIFKETFCPTERTFQFMEDVLTEVIALFPDSPYVHIGGDEVLKDHWKESAFVQELKKRENLKDEHEVQSYFIRRIERFINSKGKKIIGWDEILEGGLAPNATVMSWRGEKGGIEAAKAKHDVVMTPTSYLYFDYGQGDPAYEPLNIGSFVPLENVYNYNPHPKELTGEEKKYVLGAQANLWTEYIKTPEKVEYMVFPRALALAEVVWSPHEKKNFADFQKRLRHHFALLDRQKVNYRIPEPAGLRNAILKDAGRATVELGSPLAGGKIFYTTDGAAPTAESALYRKPIEIALREGEKAELKTVVVAPDGRRSAIYAATFLRRRPLPAVELAERKPGVRVRFFKGKFQSVRDLDAAPPGEAGEVRSILLNQFAGKTDKLKEPFGAAFEGYVYAPREAIYEFQIEADDGATLEIGGETVINLDAAVRGKQTQTAVVPLSQGYHPVRLKYFQAGGEAAVLILRHGVKGQGLSRVYGGELFR